jgi:hypothetical protein
MATINIKGMLMEVTVRCENRLQLFGRRTFYSMVPHTFIMGKRFVDIRDSIAKYPFGKSPIKVIEKNLIEGASSYAATVH